MGRMSLAASPFAKSCTAATGSLGIPSVRAKTLVLPPGRMASAVCVPATPVATSFSVPSPPKPTTTSSPRRAASWAKRIAWPRRLVSTISTSLSAVNALWMTTVLRAVTDEANALTTIRMRKTATISARVAVGGRAYYAVTMVPHERHRLRQADPRPGDAGRARQLDQYLEARGQADPRRVGQLWRGDGAATRRCRRRRRGQPGLDGSQQRGQRAAYGAGDGRGEGHPDQRSQLAGQRCADDCQG